MISLPIIIIYFILNFSTTHINGLNNSDIHFIVTQNTNNNNPPDKINIKNNKTVATASVTEHPRLFSLQQAIKSSFLSEILGKVNVTRTGPKKNGTTISVSAGNNKKRPNTKIRLAVRKAAEEGLNAVVDLYEKREKEILQNGNVLEEKSPGAMLAKFSAPVEGYENDTKLAYGALFTAKKLKET